MMSASVLPFERTDRHGADALRDAPQFVRANGRLLIESRASGNATTIHQVSEEGSLRVRFPRERNEHLTAVAINTGGGVTGGDRFSIDCVAGANSALVFTTAAAEKFYRSTGAMAGVDINIRIDAGASLAWLPQEAIIFEGARLKRRMNVSMADGATVLICDLNCIGRAAMGEEVKSLWLNDQWRIHMGGELALADFTHIDGAASAILSRPCVANGGSFGSLFYAGPQLESIAAGWAVIIANCNKDDLAACGIVDGLLIARMSGPSMERLRMLSAQLIAAANVTPLPRSWAT